MVTTQVSHFGVPNSAPHTHTFHMRQIAFSFPRVGYHFRVELALWTHFVAVQLKPDLLDRIPTSNAINSDSTELETIATGNNDDETIKMATSDDAEITADEENSTDMVSSSKDEDDTTTDGELKMEQNSISGKVCLIVWHFSSANAIF